MANSPVEIASNALYLLGAKPITDFDEGTDRANLMNALYPVTRDATQRAHPWRFARELFEVVKEPTAPKWKWSTSYTLSPNPYVLRVIEVNGDRDGHRWAVYGRKIYANLGSPIQYEAIIRVTDTLIFDSLYEEALTYRLAAAAAMPVAESRTLLEAMMNAYADKIAEARTISSQEGYPDDADMGQPLITARLSSGDRAYRAIKPV